MGKPNAGNSVHNPDIAVNISFGDKCNINPVSIEYNYMSFIVDKQN
jgi:hypothetical protein